jgi:hypothetical protein
MPYTSYVQNLWSRPFQLQVQKYLFCGLILTQYKRVQDITSYELKYRRPRFNYYVTSESEMQYKKAQDITSYEMKYGRQWFN